MRDTKYRRTYRRYSTHRVRVTLRVCERADTLNRSAAIAEYARAIYARWDDGVEHFCAILLDAKQNVIGYYRVSTGIQTASLVHPRETFAPAIVLRACGIVLVHNHPSGDPEPSPEDHAITERLRDVGELVGIPVLDHIVLAEGSERYVSFLERRWIIN